METISRLRGSTAQALGADRALAAGRDGEAGRVLIADDDPAVRLLCALSLTAEGLEVLESEDGLDALEQARCACPDLILTDVTMRGLDGFQLADGKYYNGATFDGFVDRPRQQFNLASNWFLTLGGHSHNVKVGYDLQLLESGAQFDYPDRRFYNVDDYIQATRTPVFGPQTSREDYDSGASISKGTIHAI